MTKRKPFRTYLSFLCMHMAPKFDHEWVQFAALNMVKRRVASHLREYEELGIEHDESDDPEHIIVTYH